MPYWELYYHFVWTTKNRLPLISPETEAAIYECMCAKATSLGAIVFAMNGMPDHVHLVAAIPPKIALSKLIGQVQKAAFDLPLLWQKEYGAFSFDRNRLPNYIAYVERQKDHHAQNSIIPQLERTEDSADKLVREVSSIYTIDDKTWRREFSEMRPTGES